MKVSKNRTGWFLAAVAAVIVAACAVGADEDIASPQTSPATSMSVPGGSLTRDEELYLLVARQAQLDLDQARAEMEKAKVELEQVRILFDEKLVTVEKLNEAQQEYEQAILKHEQAKIELRKKRLEFLKDATLVTVVDAKKYRDVDNNVIASIRLRNDSDISKARIAMAGSGQLAQGRLESLLKVDNGVGFSTGTAGLMPCLWLNFHLWHRASGPSCQLPCAPPSTSPGTSAGAMSRTR